MSRPFVGSVDHLFPAGSLDQVNSWQPEPDAEGKLVLPAKMKAVVKQAIGSKKQKQKKRKAESESESEEEEKPKKKEPKRAKSAMNETTPHEWTTREDCWIHGLRSDGRTFKYIAEQVGQPAKDVRERFLYLEKKFSGK